MSLLGKYIKQTGLFVCLCLISISALAQAGSKRIRIEVVNPTEKKKLYEPVVIKLPDLSLDFTVRSAIVWDGDTEIPSQLDDLTGDRRADELAFVLDVPAGATKTITIDLSAEKTTREYPAQVYAEMLVSDKNGKHVPITSLTIPGTSNIYNQLHHHGPAFESELVAYRIYFDQKQTVDIYGKFNKGFEIEESQFYPTDEQLARGFGDDVLRVSGSCGLGTFKGWNGEKAIHIQPVSSRSETIRAYGPVRTVVDVIANDWEYQGSVLQMTTRYILYAGHRDCEVQLFFEEPLQQEIFCTGVQNIKGSDSFSDQKGLIGCWGTDWPVNDTIKYAKETVGLAVSLPENILAGEANDKVNYLYLIQAPRQTQFNYHITFTSMKETFGYKTKEEWFAYIQEWKKEVVNPCRVTILE
ncbi:MAG: DUF4861 domain-containing protein [Tannerellaceae bacterium]|nr:DUF4861 domain-containing protein [Tannerellaceae bacterium]